MPAPPLPQQRRLHDPARDGRVLPEEPHIRDVPVQAGGARLRVPHHRCARSGALPAASPRRLHHAAIDRHCGLSARERGRRVHLALPDAARPAPADRRRSRGSRPLALRAAGAQRAVLPGVRRVHRRAARRRAAQAAGLRGVQRRLPHAAEERAVAVPEHRLGRRRDAGGGLRAARGAAGEPRGGGEGVCAQQSCHAATRWTAASAGAHPRRGRAAADRVPRRPARRAAAGGAERAPRPAFPGRRRCVARTGEGAEPAERAAAPAAGGAGPRGGVGHAVPVVALFAGVLCAGLPRRRLRAAARAARALRRAPARRPRAVAEGHARHADEGAGGGGRAGRGGADEGDAEGGLARGAVLRAGGAGLCDARRKAEHAAGGEPADGLREARAGGDAGGGECAREADDGGDLLTEGEGADG